MVRNLKVKTKLVSGFSAVILIFCVAIAFSVYFIDGIRTQSHEQSGRVHDEKNALELKYEVGLLYSNQADVIINQSSEAADAFKKLAPEFLSQVSQVSDAADTPEEKQWAEQLTTAAKQYVANFDRVLEVFGKKGSMSAEALSGEYKKIDDQTDEYKGTIFTALDRMVESYDHEYEEADANLDAEIRLTIQVTIILCAAAVVLALVFALFMGRLIGNPLVALSSAARKVADGDLTASIAVRDSRDEIGVLTNSFSAMIANLKSLLKEIDAHAEQVAASSEEMTSSAEQSAKGSQQVAEDIGHVASGAETQEISAGETARAMSEMAAGVQKIAESTSVIAEVATDAAVKARDGDVSVQLVVVQMEAIQESVDRQIGAVGRLERKSREIGEIVGAISGIAMQTNLLALNAGIEAARAGEHGRGFAIVAGEVRKLAEQAAVSAERITGLVETIQEDIEETVKAMNAGGEVVNGGLETARATGEAFRGILDAVDRVAVQVQDMSAVAEQMSASSEEVAASVVELAGIAKETALSSQTVATNTEQQLAIMEEVAASSAHLSELAQILQGLIGRFKL